MRMKQLSDLNTAAAIAAGALASGAVTTAKLAADAVNGDKIADDAIGSEHIADGAVVSAAIGADAVTGAKIADDAIDSEHIAAGAIDNEHIADSTIAAAKLAGSILTSQLADAASFMFNDADIDANSQKIINVATGTASTDAVNKAQLDAAIQGLSPKEAVRAASTGNVALASEVEAGDTLDGVTLQSGDRILLKNQTNAEENGVYVVVPSGAPSRASDADSEDDLLGMFCIVMEGTTNADTAWILATDASIVVDTTELTYVAFSGVSGIADGSITTAKLGADAVTGAKIADDAVDSEHIAAGAVDAEHLAADIVDGSKVADDAIDSEHIAAGALDPEHFAASAVQTAALADDAVTAAKLAAGIVSIGLGVGDAGDIYVTPGGAYSGSSVETDVDASAAYLGRPWIKLNDSLYRVGTTGSGTDPFWFAASGQGGSPRSFGSIVAGDKLFVDTDTLGFTLDTSDRLSVVFAGPNG